MATTWAAAVMVVATAWIGSHISYRGCRSVVLVVLVVVVAVLGTVRLVLRYQPNKKTWDTKRNE